MTTTTATGRTVATAGAVRNGATLMAVAAAGFIGYAGLFLVRNFTNSFLELGIGPKEVDVSKDQIQQFSPSLYHYISHLHIAVSGSPLPPGWPCCWPSTVSVPGRSGPRRRRRPSARPGDRATRPLPLEPRHPRPPRAHLPGHAGVRGRRAAVRQGPAGRQTHGGVVLAAPDLRQLPPTSNHSQTSAAASLTTAK